jgi:class 3 adenylate cyclase/tetratricopeptide (TPR) repeat protein
MSGGAERKLATIVFADLVGSTTLVAGRDPEDVRRSLEPFFETTRRTFEEHDGRVEKYIGDAAMAVFGVPRAHGDDPDRAVAAALALVERLAGEQDQLELRVGIETGEVLAAERGGDLAVTGEAVNAAARLQQAAEPGQVLVGARAASACRTARFGEPREVAAKGFPEPLVARAATGTADEDAVGVAAQAAQEAAPLLGRGGELESLRLAYLRSVRERRPRLVLIVGEAGAGKTRLTRELIDAVSSLDPQPLLLAGRNPPYGDGIAFWALAELLRDAAGAAREDGAQQVRAALAARLDAAGAPRAEETATTLAATLDGGDAESDAAAIRRSWRQLIAGLADERPVLMAVDDLHWADDGFLDLVEDAAGLPAQPVLVLCTARPEIDEIRPDLAAGERRERLELGPLAPAAAEELAAALVGGADVELAQQIAATSGGNPFFTEEIARAIAGNGAEAAPSLPDTVQAAIASRLDALPGPEKLAIQYAAVLGDRFRAVALGELLGSDPATPLAGLERRTLIEDRTADEDDLYGFHHQLIREVAYASLTRAERVELHVRAAAGVASRAGERYAELAEVVAFHFARAAELDPDEERRRAAFESSTRASTHAARRGAVARAQELLEQAAEFAPDDPRRIEVLERASQLAMHRLRGDDAVRLLVEAAELAEQAGDANAAARCYAIAVEFASRLGGVSGRFEEAYLHELLARADRLVPEPDPDLAARLRLDRGWISWSYGRPDEMAPPVAEGLELARQSDDALLRSCALDAASATAWWAGNYAEVEALNRERVEVLAAAPQSPLVGVERSDAISMITESLMRTGKLREALRWDDLNANELASIAPHIAGARSVQALYLLGDWDRAIERGVRVRENWIAEGRPPFAPFAPDLGAVAAIHGLRGDEASHADWASVAEEVAGMSQQLPGIRMLEAEVALHFGEVERAVALVEGLWAGFWWQGPFLARQAEILAIAGRDDAREALARAEARPPGDPYAAAVALRARAVIAGDEAPLREALATFERIECAYEAARTRWMLGGEERDAAREAFERLGAVVIPE